MAEEEESYDNYSDDFLDDEEDENPSLSMSHPAKEKTRSGKGSANGTVLQATSGKTKTSDGDSFFSTGTGEYASGTVQPVQTEKAHTPDDDSFFGTGGSANGIVLRATSGKTKTHDSDSFFSTGTGENASVTVLPVQTEKAHTPDDDSFFGSGGNASGPLQSVKEEKPKTPDDDSFFGTGDLILAAEVKPLSARNSKIPMDNSFFDTGGRSNDPETYSNTFPTGGHTPTPIPRFIRPTGKSKPPQFPSIIRTKAKTCVSTMSPWRSVERHNPYSFASLHLFHQLRSQDQVRRGRRGKGRGQGAGRQSQALSDSHVDVVTKRLLSANQLRIKELQNQLQDMKAQLLAVRDDNKLFKQVQNKQARALRRFEDTESQLPQMIQSHNSEVHSLREQLRRYKEKFEKTDRYLRDAEDELDKTNVQMKKYKTLSEQRNLGEREDLERRLKKVETALEEKDSRIVELERHIEMVKKNHRHEMGIERARAKDTLRQMEELREEKAKMEAAIRDKERMLEARNIYSNRTNGTPSHSPPLWRQSLNRQLESMTDLSFRDRAKAYEEKRRLEAAEKKEKKQVKSQELKTNIAAAEDGKEKDRSSMADNTTTTTTTTTQPQREDSEAEFWRRQEALYKQGQNSQEKQEEERRRKQEEEARLQAELDKMKRDMEERERAAQRMKQEAEERQRKERDRVEEAERKEREAREKEKEREERERLEAEQQAKERREQELREREEKEMEAQLAEERRQKEELMQRLHNMNGPQNKPRTAAQPFTPSPTKRKDYNFTQPVENLHRGKPSHDPVSVPVVDRQKKLGSAMGDSEFGGYQPSFTGPIKTTAAMKSKKPFSLIDDGPRPAATSNGTDMKQKPLSIFDDNPQPVNDAGDRDIKKKPLSIFDGDPKSAATSDGVDTKQKKPFSLFDDDLKPVTAAGGTDMKKKPLSLFDDDPKPVAPLGVGGGDKKSRLMADLFGSTASSKKDSEDLFLGDRPTGRPLVQNRRAAAFPWDNPSPASSKPREPEKRGTSALFGGGAAVIDDSDSAGNAEKQSTMLPRRPRQTTTTFSTKPAILAVNNFDDDIEEVVL